MNRRRYIGILGASSLSALAGCNSSGSTNTAPPTDTTTENTPTSEPASFRVTDLSQDSADIGDDVQIQLEVENTGGTDATWEAEYAVVSTNGPEPEQTDYDVSTISEYVPAGESRFWRSETVTYDRPRILYYRIGDRSVQTIEIPDSRSPIIDEVNLVSDWETYGDAIDNSISEVAVGEEVNIASRYWYWLENQTLDIFSQVEVYNDSGERVDISTGYSEQVSEYNGWTSWERYHSFNSTGWDSGTYTAEVLIRDEQNNEVSNAGTVEFEVV